MVDGHAHASNYKGQDGCHNACDVIARPHGNADSRRDPQRRRSSETPHAVVSRHYDRSSTKKTDATNNLRPHAD